VGPARQRTQRHAGECGAGEQRRQVDPGAQGEWATREASWAAALDRAEASTLR
jgi:hypothetical protein